MAGGPVIAARQGLAQACDQPPVVVAVGAGQLTDGQAVGRPVVPDLHAQVAVLTQLRSALELPGEAQDAVADGGHLAVFDVVAVSHALHSPAAFYRPSMLRRFALGSVHKWHFLYFCPLPHQQG